MVLTPANRRVFWLWPLACHRHYTNLFNLILFNNKQFNSVTQAVIAIKHQVYFDLLCDKQAFYKEQIGQVKPYKEAKRALEGNLQALLTILYKV